MSTGFSLHPTGLPGCFELRPPRSDDERGRFVKIFNFDAFVELGLDTDFREEYYSSSRQGVIRGLHFQVPPAHHTKLVYCVEGTVQDVVVDLRAGSPSFGKHAIIELSADAANMVYIPAGLAHGFCVLSKQATLVYKVTSQYSAPCDQGILWDSAGIDWAVTSPILSARDKSHPRLQDFLTPFRFFAEEPR